MKNSVYLVLLIITLTPILVKSQFSCTYDNKNRLTKVNYSPDCHFVHFTYDQDDNRITDSEKYLVLNETISNLICPNDSGSIILNPSNVGLTFLWSTGATTPSLNNVPPGSYSLTITETATGNSCTRDYTIQPSLSGLATIHTHSISCHGRNDGSAAVTILGGYGAYKYLWSNGGLTDSISNLPSGTYSVDVTDTIFNCVQHLEFTITEPTTFLNGFTSADPTCFGSSDGMALINVNGNPNNYTYQWSNGGTSQFIINLPAAIYSVSVTDTNGCSMNDSIQIHQPQQLVLSALTTSVCDSASNGAILAQATGGTPAYQFSLDGLNFSTNVLFINLNAGSHLLYGLDANGCLDSAVYIIINHEALNNSPITLSNDTLLTSPYPSSNSWYLVGDTMPLGNLSNYTCTSFGRYFVIGLDSNQCQAISDTITACIILEVNQTNSTEGVSSYPNPTFDETIINFLTSIKGNVSVTMYDLAGKMVLYYEEKQVTDNTILLKHHGLPAGVYLLEVLNAGNKYISKLVVQ